jgi:hypothetical protein
VSGLGFQVSVTVEDTLNENWRGLYDILVTARGQDFGAADAFGTVDPNFVATGGRYGISVDDWDLIREIDGVEVAAPIGMVGALRRTALAPSLQISSDPVTGISALRTNTFVALITSTVALTDVDEEQTVSKGTGRVWLQTQSGTDANGLPADHRSSGGGAPQGFSPLQTGHDLFVVPLGVLPAFSSNVVAVDPVAETMLLGEQAGAFLAPLVEAPITREPTSEWQHLMDCDAFSVQCAQIGGVEGGFIDAQSVVPMIVNRTQSRELTLRVSIALASESFPELENVDENYDEVMSWLESLPEASFEPWDSFETRIDGVLVPFSSADLSILLPGSVLPEGEGSQAFFSTAVQLQPRLLERPDFVAASESHGSTVELQVQPREVVGPSGLGQWETYEAGYGMDSSVGLVRAFHATSNSDGASGVLPAPIGTFSLSDISEPDVSEVSYVPTGVSGSASTWSVDADDTPIEVLPNLSGLDFITPAPGAFTDLAGGATLRGSTPIDAVRVRVAGVSAYTPEAQARIAEVAGQIALLGLDVRIVAGSSLQQVSLYVPEYFQEADGSWSDLGWVTQEWTTLGAAATVELALSGTTLVLAAAALAAGGFGLGATALINGRRLRPVVAGLGKIGWRSGYIRRRLALELLPPYVLLAAVSVMCWRLGPPNLSVLFLAAAGVAVAVFLAELVSGMRSARVAFPAGHDSGQGIASPAALAWALTRSRFSWAVLTAASSAVIAGLAALTAVALRDGIEQAGHTRLAELMLRTTQWMTVGIGVLGVGSAVVLLLLGYQAERASLANDTLVLTRVGFTRAVQIGIARRQQLFVALGCVVGAAITITAVSVVFGGWLACLVGGATLVLVIGARLIAGLFMGRNR